jgi:cell wall-associated NlpC family hydrolase
MIRDRIVTEARDWLGTPYQHQCGLKGVASDCVGYVVGVLQEIGIVAPNWWQREGAAFGGYGRTSGAAVMLTAMRAHFREVPVDQAQAGDIVYMSFGAGLHHAGILVPYRHGGLALVHALSTAGRVTEHRLDVTWRGYIKAAFAVPEVA